jgi:hypothetical protein
MNDKRFDPEAWAQTVPHSFYSRWPTATHTKCDYCGVYFKDHPADVADEDDVARHPVTALRRHHERDVR